MFGKKTYEQNLERGERDKYIEKSSPNRGSDLGECRKMNVWLLSFENCQGTSLA